jgi:hypothetical protein
MTVLTESRSLFASLASCLLVCACQGYAGPAEADATKTAAARLSAPSRTWDSQATLIPSDGIAQAQFATVVAIDGDTAIVGAPGDGDTSHTADYTGSAYVWVRSGASWTLQQKLESPNPAAGQQFGSVVAVSGDVAVVGAIGDDGHGDFSGAVYIFERTGTTWTAVPQKLTDEGATASFELYGSSLAVNGDKILIGAPGNSDKSTGAGAAFLFKRQGASWIQATELFASDPLAGAQFGYSVALSTDTAVVGAPDADASKPTDSAAPDASAPDPTVPDTGAAYVFSDDFSGTPAKLLSSDHTTSDVFGVAATVSGSTVAIGAVSASGGLDSSAPLRAGAVYIFTGSSASWTEQQKLFKPDAAPLESFGNGVSLDGDSLFVSCPHNADDTGSAFAFTRSKDVWSNGIPLPPPKDLETGDTFGQSVAFSGQTAIVGTVGLAVGRATVFALATSSPCSIAGDCTLGNCTEGICCSTSCAGTCVSCLAARKTSGIDDGTCGPVLAATDPRDSCDAQATGTCGTTGLCDGNGSCSQYPAGTACADSSCSTLTTTQSSLCDGSGACKTTPGEDCGSYVCRAGECPITCTTNSDCAPSSFCSAASKCELTQPLRCNVNATAVIGTDGTTLIKLCGDYKCINGACLTTCKGTDDCSGSLACNTTSKACAPKCKTASTCADGQACDPVDHVCTKVCSSAQDCPDNDNCGPVSHKCTKNAECKQTSDCANGLGCDPISKLCAKRCTAASDCPEANAACDPVNGICVSACSQAKDCKDGLNCGATRLCTTDMACALTSDCADPLVCDPVGHSCTQSCSTANDCESNFACDPVNKVCTKFCAAAGDCGEGLNCSPTTHQCTPTTTCSSSSDCATGLACSPNSHQCITDKEHSPSPAGCSCSLDQMPNDWNRRGTPLAFLAFLSLMMHRRAGRRDAFRRFLSTKKRKREA